MKIRELNLYKNFSCLAGGCPHTCCHGWLIPISDDDRLRFYDQKGLLGLRLNLALLASMGQSFSNGRSTCPFLNRQKLCSLQLEKGAAFIPEACRDYPRFYRNYGFVEERMVDLSCIQAALSFVSNIDSLYFEEFEGENESELSTTNDDREFYFMLIRERDEMTGSLDGCTGFDTLKKLVDQLYQRQIRLQNECIKKAGITYCDTEGCAEICLFPFSAATLDRLLDTSLFSPLLKSSNPALYDLFNLYFKDYRHKMSNEKAWAHLYTGFMEKYPDFAHYLAGYLKYYLLQYYLKNYEDYSFRRNISLGLIHLNLVFMLCVLSEIDSRTAVTSEKLAEIIAVYNRRAYFNDSILDELYTALNTDTAVNRVH